MNIRWAVTGHAVMTVGVSKRSCSGSSRDAPGTSLAGSGKALDGSQHKAPFGGEGTGPNPVDRGKCGWKWSIATDRAGIPIGWEQAGANRNDCKLFEPTLDAIDARGLIADIETLHLDRGYDNNEIRQLCTDLALAITIIVTIKLIKWADRWSPTA
jgi:hypothetical protein